MSKTQRAFGEVLCWRILLVVIGVSLGLLAPAFAIDQPVWIYIDVPGGLGALTA